MDIFEEKSFRYKKYVFSQDWLLSPVGCANKYVYIIRSEVSHSSVHSGKSVRVVFRRSWNRGKFRWTGLISGKTDHIQSSIPANRNGKLPVISQSVVQRQFVARLETIHENIFIVFFFLRLYDKRLYNRVTTATVCVRQYEKLPAVSTSCCWQTGEIPYFASYVVLYYHAGCHLNFVKLSCE